TIKKQDILLHYPYQTFDYVIDFLREAAMDPKVTSIKISLYRVAKNSKVVNALINAVKNGKSVTVVMELQARFDEAANIYWSNILRDEGVRVIHGVPGLKVHAKMILVTRQTKKGISLFANLGTGNYNESTAKIYSDHALFTADRRLTREVEKVFEFLEKNYKRETFRHLLVSPFNIRQRLVKLINSEIKNANKGKPAYIIAKLNNLTDPKLIKKLYEAGQVGVKIHLMVRSMFSLIPGEENVSENIDAISIVDKFLEHSRFFVFCNGGENKYYLTSADWMPRNLDNRVEVTFPIYDPSIQQEIKEFINIQWQDNVKARILNPTLDNQY
ncbi:MAG: polyphosphate kinase 1, partial [Calditrichae bacterium]|nr:polyphosphate kinase 1 [Calditrichia bacterium]